MHNCGFDVVERVERGIVYTFHSAAQPTTAQLTDVAPLLYDRMIEAPTRDVESLFERINPQPLMHIPVLAEGRKALERANRDMGLALAEDEVDYFLQTYQSAKRDPTDVELMMFSVVNSEHILNKIYNDDFKIDGELKRHTLFDMIHNTTPHSQKARSKPTLWWHSTDIACRSSGPKSNSSTPTPTGIPQPTCS